MRLARMFVSLARVLVPGLVVALLVMLSRSAMRLGCRLVVLRCFVMLLMGHDMSSC